MNREEFETRLHGAPVPVLVEFWAPWCMPCRAMAPALDRVKTQYEGRVEVWKINADEHPQLVRDLGILGIPTVMVYRGSQRVAQRTGMQSEQDLVGLSQQALGEPPPARTLAPIDRLLRMGAGLLLLVIVLSFDAPEWLLLPAALLAFSAVYDRCPIYQAIAPRIRAVFGLQKY